MKGAQAAFAILILESSSPAAGAAATATTTAQRAPQGSTGQQEQQRPMPARAARPTITLHQWQSSRESQLSAIVDRQLEKLRRLIRVTEADDPERPDLLFRLADLLTEKHGSAVNSAEGLEERIFNAPPASKEPLRRAQAELRREAAAWASDAAKAYAAVAKARSYQRRDAALYKLGWLLASAGSRDDGARAMRLLIQDHPTSPYVPDALLSLAEDRFDRGEMREALQLYDKVVQFPGSGVYAFALYKRAWCWMNLGEHKAALQAFTDITNLLRHPEAGSASGNRSQLVALQKEVRRDLVAAYAHVGSTDKAWELFQRVGGGFAPQMLEMLAERMWEHGQAAASSRLFHKLMQLQPSSAMLCGWQARVMRNTLSAGDRGAQVQELRRLGAAWRQQQARSQLPRGERDECTNAYHDAARDLAQVLHKEAHQTRSFDLADAPYREFLTSFPRDPEAYRMTFFYAELLWSMAEREGTPERWQTAAEQYTAVVHMNPSGGHTQEAARAAVLAWEKALAIDDAGDRRIPPRRPS